MKEEIYTKKDLKEKSIECQIPFANLLEGFLLESLLFSIAEADTKNCFWLKDTNRFGIEAYKKEWQQPLRFVYRKEINLTEFFEAVCAKNPENIIWTFAVEKVNSAYKIQFTGEWEEMTVPLMIEISELSYEAVVPEKIEIKSAFYRKKKIECFYFPAENIVAEQFFSIIKYLELINTMEPYFLIYELVKKDAFDGRHICEALKLLCKKEELTPDLQRFQMFASYENYSFMRKKWKKYVKNQKKISSDFPAWEDLMKKEKMFFEPVWRAVVNDEIFFGDWMPDLERYL